MNYLPSAYFYLYAQFKSYRYIMGEEGKHAYFRPFYLHLGGNPPLTSKLACALSTKNSGIVGGKEGMYLSPAASLCRGIKSSRH